MQIHRLEFEVTYRCNSRCQHCQVGEGKRHTLPAVIDRDLAVEIVRKVAQAQAPFAVMTFGGEPLLYPQVVCAIHEAAMLAGIPRREIITNAGTPRSAKRANEVAQRLASSGVIELCISVDAFHQAYVPLEIVERNVQAYIAAGIPRLEWNPCWVVSEEGDNPWDQRTRAILDRLAYLPVRRGEGNRLQPIGSAQKWLSEYLPPKQPLPEGSCADVPYSSRLDQMTSLGIAPNGDATICFDWSIGNAADEDILQIIDRYDPEAIPEAKAILEQGMAGLIEYARKVGVSPDSGGYFSICDLCIQLRQKIRLAQLAGDGMLKREAR